VGLCMRAARAWCRKGLARKAIGAFIKGTFACFKEHTTTLIHFNANKQQII